MKLHLWTVTVIGSIGTGLMVGGAGMGWRDTVVTLGFVIVWVFSSVVLTELRQP